MKRGILLSGLLLAVGLAWWFVRQPRPIPAPPSAVGWVPAHLVSQKALEQPPIGHWLAVDASNYDTALDDTVIQDNSTTTLYELLLNSAGTYSLRWQATSHLTQLSSTSSAEELGHWSWLASTLTLTPDFQRASYTTDGQTRSSENLDLHPREYSAWSLLLASVADGGLMRGVRLEGAAAPWDLERHWTLNFEAH